RGQHAAHDLRRRIVLEIRGRREVVFLRRSPFNAEAAEDAEFVLLGRPCGLCVPYLAPTVSSVATGLMNGISERSRGPTCSMRRLRSLSRIWLNHGRPCAFSAIQPAAYFPVRTSSRICFIVRRVSSVTIFGPPV